MTGLWTRRMLGVRELERDRRQHPRPTVARRVPGGPRVRGRLWTDVVHELSGEMAGDPDEVDRVLARVSRAVGEQKASGCVCDPGWAALTIEAGGDPVIHMFHDPWCPFVRARDTSAAGRLR